MAFQASIWYSKGQKKRSDNMPTYRTRQKRAITKTTQIKSHEQSFNSMSCRRKNVVWKKTKKTFSKKNVSRRKTET